MRQPNRDQNTPLSNETKITIILVLLGMGILLLITLLALLLRGDIFPQTAQIIPTDPPATLVIPTMSIPTPDCGPPTLVLGSTTLQIQTISPAADGSLPVPPDTSGVAYWVQGTDRNHVFVLSPAAKTSCPADRADSRRHRNRDLGKLQFHDHRHSPYPSRDSSTLRHCPTNPRGNHAVLSNGHVRQWLYVVSGASTGEQISVFNLPPASGGTEVQAEISLLDTTASTDGTTIRVNISIFNYGATAFTVTVNEVTLTPEGSPSFTVTNSEPSLPREIQPGATETFYFTFPRPPTSTATLRVFTVEYDVEGY
jgi:hypothetical protein